MLQMTNGELDCFSDRWDFPWCTFRHQHPPDSAWKCPRSSCHRFAALHKRSNLRIKCTISADVQQLLKQSLDTGKHLWLSLSERETELNYPSLHASSAKQVLLWVKLFSRLKSHFWAHSLQRAVEFTECWGLIRQICKHMKKVEGVEISSQFWFMFTEKLMNFSQFKLTW